MPDFCKALRHDLGAGHIVVAGVRAGHDLHRQFKRGSLNLVGTGLCKWGNRQRRVTRVVGRSLEFDRIKI